MPGRALNNKFINNINTGIYKPKKCYNCIISCNPATTPYCITQALINSVKGDVDNGLVFCGENAYKVDKIITVKELLDELHLVQKELDCLDYLIYKIKKLYLND